MIKIHRKISIFLIFSLIIQLTLPFTNPAGATGELDSLVQETDLSTDNIELSSETTSNHIKGHVSRHKNNSETDWHYHLKYDNFGYHYAQTCLKHRSLPLWGSD